MHLFVHSLYQQQKSPEKPASQPGPSLSWTSRDPPRIPSAVPQTKSSWTARRGHKYRERGRLRALKVIRALCPVSRGRTSPPRRPKFHPRNRPRRADLRPRNCRCEMKDSIYAVRAHTLRLSEPPREPVGIDSRAAPFPLSACRDFFWESRRSRRLLGEGRKSRRWTF